VTGGLTDSPADACKSLSCSCFNFFGGSKCEKCNVECKHGGIPDPDCLVCHCGAGTGWMGHDCSCQYYIIGVHVKTQTTDLDWLTVPADLGTFKETFGQDMALALGISSSRILVQDVIGDKIVYQGGYRGVEVLFYLTEDCVSISMDSTNIYRPPKVFPTYYEREKVQPLLHTASPFLFASPTSNNTNGSNPELDALVALIQSMYGDTDTILYRGYITGKINSAQDLSVHNPAAVTPKEPPIEKEKPSFIKQYYWIFILIGVLIICLVGFLIWKRKAGGQFTALQRKDVDLQTLTTTDVRAVFQSGEIDRSGVADRTDTADRPSLPLSPTIPEGWTKIFEEKSGHYYYYNTKTGESQWHIPQHAA
jgi:hypothetical protein